jgi:flagellar motor switch protein FliG
MASPSSVIRPAYSGLEKAAIVLLSLGPSTSGEILKRMPEDEVSAISSTIAKLEPVSQQQVEAVLAEYQTALTGGGVDVRGGLENVRTLLTQAFGRDQAMRLMDRVSKALDQDAVDFSSLRRVDPQQLAKFIQDEHPQTIALVLSHLDPSQAAALITALPAEIRTNIATRMGGLEQISPEAVRTIAAVIGQKLRNLGELSREACGGVRAVADMFNRLDATNCSALLEGLEKDDPVLFEGVRRFMFVFEDLTKVSAQGIKELLATVDRKVLTVALKGTSEELQKAFMGALSQRGGEMLKDDMEALGPMKIKEIDAAQQLIITEARRLEKEGTISLKDSATEQYIA